MIAAPVGHQCPTCVAEARREFRQGPGRRVAVANAQRVSVTNAILVILIAVYVLEVVRGGLGSFVGGPDLLVDGRPGGHVPAGGRARRRDMAAVHRDVPALRCLPPRRQRVLAVRPGQHLERELGRPRFALLYLLSGLAASAASYAFSDLGTVSAGASGAIFGIFGAVFAVNYRRRHTAMGAMAMRSMVQIIVINVVINVLVERRTSIGGPTWAGPSPVPRSGSPSRSRGASDSNRVATVVGIAAISAVIVLTVDGSHGPDPRLADLG